MNQQQCYKEDELSGFFLLPILIGDNIDKYQFNPEVVSKTV